MARSLGTGSAVHPGSVRTGGAVTARRRAAGSIGSAGLFGLDGGLSSLVEAAGLTLAMELSPPPTETAARGGAVHGSLYDAQLACLVLPQYVRFIMLHAGWGGGKTFCGAFLTACYALASAQSHGLIMTLTHGLLYRTILTEFRRLFARIRDLYGIDVAEYRPQSGPTPARLIWINGAEDFLTSDRQGIGNVGQTLSRAWCDEIELYGAPRTTWLQIVTPRIREQSVWPVHVAARYQLATSTLEGGGGVYGLFDDAVRQGDPDYALVRMDATTAAAADRRGQEALRKQLSSEDFDEKIRGVARMREGAIYGRSFGLEEWTPGAERGNLIPWRYRGDLPTIVSVDPGSIRAAVVWAQHDVEGRYVAEDTLIGFAEWCPDGVSAQTICDYIIRQIKSKWRCDAICYDPHGDFGKGFRRVLDRALSVAGLSGIEILHPSRRHTERQAWGIGVMQARIRTADGRRRLLISSTAPDGGPVDRWDVEAGEAIDQTRDIETGGRSRGSLSGFSGGYRWHTARAGILDARGQPDKGTHDHMMDAWRMLVLSYRREESEGYIASTYERGARRGEGSDAVGYGGERL